MICTKPCYSKPGTFLCNKWGYNVACKAVTNTLQVSHGYSLILSTWWLDWPHLHHSGNRLNGTFFPVLEYIPAYLYKWSTSLFNHSTIIHKYNNYIWKLRGALFSDLFCSCSVCLSPIVTNSCQSSPTASDVSQIVVDSRRRVADSLMKGQRSRNVHFWVQRPTFYM